MYIFRVFSSCCRYFKSFCPLLHPQGWEGCVWMCGCMCVSMWICVKTHICVHICVGHKSTTLSLVPCPFFVFIFYCGSDDMYCDSGCCYADVLLYLSVHGNLFDLWSPLCGGTACLKQLPWILLQSW